LSRARFPPPWSAELQPNHYVVRDANKQRLAYVYFENEPGRSRQTDGSGLPKKERSAAVACEITSPAGFSKPICSRATGRDELRRISRSLLDVHELGKINFELDRDDAFKASLQIPS